MGNGLIAFLFSIGTATWVYTKVIRRTGGNTQSTLIVSGAAGVIVFIVMFTVLLLITSQD